MGIERILRGFIICLGMAASIMVLIACSPSISNTATISNDVKTNQSLHFNCVPRESVCPYQIPFKTRGIYKNVQTITVTYWGQLFEITFPKNGHFHLMLSSVVSQKQLWTLKGQCITVKIHKTDEIIDCNTGKVTKNNSHYNGI